MKIVLDNAQSTPHIDAVDKNGIIRLQVSFCSDGVLIDGKPLEQYPEKDGIVLYPKKK